MSWVFVTAALIPLILMKAVNTDSIFATYLNENNFDIKVENYQSILEIAGISYFTFNSISYLIDVRRRYIEPEKNFFFLLLYIIYFPCILSGPLHRAKYLFGLFKNVRITAANVSCGLRLILFGLFKNLVIAKRLFLMVTLMQDSNLGGIYYLLCGLTFFLFLYFSFSSFVDLFRGISKIFNIPLKDNFRNRIYLSRSRQQFWKGWHITLNEWFRDYVFFNLAKRDKRRRHTDKILLLTFLLIALWHDLTFVFLIWGLLNGMWIILEKKVAFDKWPLPKLRSWLGIVYHLVISSFLALLFIASDIKTFVRKLFLSPANFPTGIVANHMNTILLLFLSFLIVDYHYLKAGDLKFDEYLDKKNGLYRWSVYLQLTFLLLLFGVKEGVDNYYIQF